MSVCTPTVPLGISVAACSSAYRLDYHSLLAVQSSFEQRYSLAILHRPVAGYGKHHLLVGAE